MVFKSSSVILTRTPSLELLTLTQHHSSLVAHMPEGAWQYLKASLQDQVEEKGETDRGKGEEDKAKTEEGRVQIMRQAVLVVLLSPEAWVPCGGSCAASLRP